MSGIAIDEIRKAPTSVAELGAWAAKVADAIESGVKTKELKDRATDEAIAIHKQVLASEEGKRVQTRTRAGDPTDLGLYINNDGTVRFYDETVEYRGTKVHLPGLLTDQKTCGEWQERLQDATQARTFHRLAMGSGPTLAKYGGIKTRERLDGEFVRLCFQAPASIRAALDLTLDQRANAAKKSDQIGDSMSKHFKSQGFGEERASFDFEAKSFADVSGYGGEWIPDNYSGDLIRPATMPDVVESLFPVENITGPATVIFTLTGQARCYLLNPPNQSDQLAKVPATNITTSSQSIAPVELASLFNMRITAIEDGEVDIQRFMAEHLPATHRAAVGDMIVNGDSTATHQDAIASWNIDGRWGASGLGGSNDHRRGWIGLRALAQDNSSTHTVDMGSMQTVSDIAAQLFSRLGKFASMDGTVLICGLDLFWKKIATDTNVLTVDKYGQGATILRGEVAALFGKPLVVSPWMSADLASSGLFTGSGAKAGLLAANTKSFRVYRRRAPTLEIVRDSTTRTVSMVTTERLFFGRNALSSECPVVYGYNYL
jgi:hypothetical protein